jgi:hypothetical protein
VRAKRWDGDERGAGIASGEPFALGLAALQAQLAIADWIAEEPHAHLLPHIARACAAGRDLAVVATRTGADGVFEVKLDWQPHADSPPLRNRIFAAIGSFAEGSTHVAQNPVDDGTVEYDVVTGMLREQTEFRTHGHLVRFRVAREPAPQG